MQTRTANFPIGFRRLLWSEWQKDPVALIAWMKEHDFSLIDLGRDAQTGAKPFLDAGFRIGSADLPQWNELLSLNADKRKAAIEANSNYIAACSKLGRGVIRNFFLVLLPEDPATPREQNQAHATDSLAQLAGVLDAHGCNLIIEGFPGQGAVGCTPESLRKMFAAIPSVSVGFNFDPSHLLRMNIDPVRFLEEFFPRIHHIHAKDTELFPNTLYDCGIEQTPLYHKAHDFGWHTWRYCIPGHGSFPWHRAMMILQERGYRGALSIELEDVHYNGSEEGEKTGLLHAAVYLQSC